MVGKLSDENWLLSQMSDISPVTIKELAEAVGWDYFRTRQAIGQLCVKGKAMNVGKRGGRTNIGKISPDGRVSGKRKYPKDWKAIVARVKKRSGDRCECTGQCGLHTTTGRCIERNGDEARYARGRIMLTTAHLCHDSECRKISHLIHACQRCHLRIDRDQHIANAKKTRHERRAIAELFT
jgi:hypothetical protein